VISEEELMITQKEELLRPSDSAGSPTEVAPHGPGETPPAEPFPDHTVADGLRPLLTSIFGSAMPARFEFWDGSAVGPKDGPGTVLLRSSRALRRLLWAPGELGLGRAYVAGEIDLDGDIYALLRSLQAAAPKDLRLGAGTVLAVLRAPRRVHAIGRQPKPPAEESRPRGWRHSKRRDAQAISHHYDVGNAFYRLVLGPSMTYSCARFVTDASSLEEAQAAKYESICRKLGLAERPGLRLLDVGCGWGSMAIHAATHHGASVVGVTISEAQAELARKRVAQAGVGDRVAIRLLDYRDLGGETFDAISSIGMFEHVGKERIGEYFERLYGLLEPQGRMLNHAISSVGGSKLGRRTFMGRYVFPDGELIDVGDVALAMEQAGMEIRDVESLREHYAKTLRAWIANLHANWETAVAEVGDARARIWRLYMAGSARGFEDGGIGLHQVLGVRTGPGGRSGLPATRQQWG
jgi:cyclopropane-fatty-acyl-phospholipid synthase